MKMPGENLSLFLSVPVCLSVGWARAGSVCLLRAGSSSWLVCLSVPIGWLYSVPSVCVSGLCVCHLCLSVVYLLVCSARLSSNSLPI